MINCYAPLAQHCPTYITLKNNSHRQPSDGNNTAFTDHFYEYHGVLCPSYVLHLILPPLLTLSLITPSPAIHIIYIISMAVTSIDKSLLNSTADEVLFFIFSFSAHGKVNIVTRPELEQM